MSREEKMSIMASRMSSRDVAEIKKMMGMVCMGAGSLLKSHLMSKMPIELLDAYNEGTSAEVLRVLDKIESAAKEREDGPSIKNNNVHSYSPRVRTDHTRTDKEAREARYLIESKCIDREWEPVELRAEFQTPDTLHEALIAKDCYISDNAREMLKEVPISPKKKIIKLATIIQGELSMGKELDGYTVFTLNKILEAGRKYNLIPCPPEVALLLPLQCNRKIFNITVAMRPLPSFVNSTESMVFQVLRDEQGTALLCQGPNHYDKWLYPSTWLFSVE